MVLVIDEMAKKEILRVKEYADTHRIDRNKLMRMMEFLDPPVGDQPEYVCILGETKIVYSMESQPAGWCRHLSVSVGRGEKLPSVPAVEVLMKEFGFTGDINNCENIWVERDVTTAKGKKGIAINILQQETLVVKGVKDCSLCHGTVDRHEHCFVCTKCGALGDLITGIMSRQVRG